MQNSTTQDARNLNITKFKTNLRDRVKPTPRKDTGDGHDPMQLVCTL